MQKKHEDLEKEYKMLKKSSVNKIITPANSVNSNPRKIKEHFSKFSSNSNNQLMKSEDEISSFSNHHKKQKEKLDLFLFIKNMKAQKCPYIDIKTEFYFS